MSSDRLIVFDLTELDLGMDFTLVVLGHRVCLDYGLRPRLVGHLLQGSPTTVTGYSTLESVRSPTRVIKTRLYDVSGPRLRYFYRGLSDRKKYTKTS